MNSSAIGGQYKPERTDYNGIPSTAFFPVLIVFVQFSDESSINPNGHGNNWLPGREPVFIDNLISPVKRDIINGEWWNTYSESTERISDSWMEFSRGHMHIIGEAVSVVLPHPSTYYQIGDQGIEKMNDDMYEILKQDPNIYWPYYDKWRKNGDIYEYGQDYYIDMIYKLYRTKISGAGMPAGGIAYLYNSYQYTVNYPIYSSGGNTYYINGGFGINGSGVTMFSPSNGEFVTSFSQHEHGHYLYGGGHAPYGKMFGVMAETGLDECLSPWESIKLGYMTPRMVDWVNVPPNNLYTLDDYSSRNNNSEGKVLQIQMFSTNEFFLIANRRSISTYDKLMWGDTCMGDPYFNLGDKNYGKGLYIYHCASGYEWNGNNLGPASDIDMECADGLWNYTKNRNVQPDWDGQCITYLPFYEKTNPVVDTNDISYWGYPGYRDPFIARDGKSVNEYIGNYSVSLSWFGIGERGSNQPCSLGIGKDKIYTNISDYWTSREWQGDRWDAWNVGYNEIFSPYSSPSTIDWVGAISGIFIWYQSDNGNTANLKIYRAGYNGQSESDILAITPPSRPKGVGIGIDCNQGGFVHPKITWWHNTEPDMLRGDGTKQYIIQKSTSDNNHLPLTYYDLVTVNIPANQNAEFYDSEVWIDCTDGVPIQIGYARYRVIAKDIYNDVSVPSDFASTAMFRNRQIGDNFLNPNTVSRTYNLYQNYPIPFNPATQIKFEIPKDEQVSLKIFDITGREVYSIDEFMTAGIHSITFDGSRFASGIYIYRMETGSFKVTKKMVLIK